jgi:hypothetical protein
MKTWTSVPNRGRVAIAAVVLAIPLLTALPVVAHHSTAAFDNGRVVRIEGKVTQFRWINPHASFKVEGTAEGGPDGVWTVEMTAANVLMNQGWKLNDGSQGGLYVGVILADGSTLGSTDGGGEYSDD